MAGIYLHVPFCKQACHYCDFHFSTQHSGAQELVESMVGEIMLQRDYLKGESVQTIYFGGGTPSILSNDALTLLFQTIKDFFPVVKNAEVTLEANPDDLTKEKLAGLKKIGFNRLSIGIQSFDNNILKYLNRAHDSALASKSVGLARQAGFDNVSIDLMYAIPGQSDDLWKADINNALSFQPEHISSYSLTIEEKTAFGRWATQGKLTLSTDDAAAWQLEMLVDDLEAAGYEQYEVSNFSKPGYQSQHNSSYWKQQKYLGIGPSAHSYDLVSRQYNVNNNHLYVRSLQGGKIPFEAEVLSVQDHINEYLLTTLRTSWGCDLEKLKKDFAYDLVNLHERFITDLIAQQLVVVDNNFLKLTRSGKLLADKISSDLFLVS